MQILRDRIIIALWNISYKLDLMAPFKAKRVRTTNTDHTYHHGRLKEDAVE